MARQNSPICTPTAVSGSRPLRVQIGGYLRASADHRFLRTVTRFQARRRADRRIGAGDKGTGRRQSGCRSSNIERCRRTICLGRVHGSRLREPGRQPGRLGYSSPGWFLPPSARTPAHPGVQRSPRRRGPPRTRVGPWNAGPGRPAGGGLQRSEGLVTVCRGRRILSCTTAGSERWPVLRLRGA